MIDDFDSVFSDVSQFIDLLIIDQTEDDEKIINIHSSVSREKARRKAEQTQKLNFPGLSLGQEIKQIKKELIKEEVKTALAEDKTEILDRPKSSLLPERHKQRSRPESASSEKQRRTNYFEDVTERNEDDLKTVSSKDRNRNRSSSRDKSEEREAINLVGSKDSWDRRQESSNDLRRSSRDISSQKSSMGRPKSAGKENVGRIDSNIVQRLKSIEDANILRTKQSRLAEFVTVPKSRENIIDQKTNEGKLDESVRFRSRSRSREAYRYTVSTKIPIRKESDITNNDRTKEITKPRTRSRSGVAYKEATEVSIKNSPEHEYVGNSEDKRYLIESDDISDREYSSDNTPSYITKEEIQLGRNKPAEDHTRPSSKDNQRINKNTDFFITNTRIAEFDRTSSRESYRSKSPENTFSRPISRGSNSSREYPTEKASSRPSSKGSYKNKDCQLETINEKESGNISNRNYPEERSISRESESRDQSLESGKSSSKHQSREVLEVVEVSFQIESPTTVEFTPSRASSKSRPSSQETTYKSIDQFLETVISKTSSKSSDRSLGTPKSLKSPRLSREKKQRNKDQSLLTIKELPSITKTKSHGKNSEETTNIETQSRKNTSPDRYRNKPPIAENRQSRESRSRERRTDKYIESERDRTLGTILIPSDDFVSYQEHEIQSIQYNSRIPKHKTDDKKQKYEELKNATGNKEDELTTLKSYIKEIRQKSSDPVIQRKKHHPKNRAKSEEPNIPKPRGEYHKHECSAGRRSSPKTYAPTSSLKSDSPVSSKSRDTSPSSRSAKDKFKQDSSQEKTKDRSSKFPKVKYVRSISPAENGKNIVKIPKELFDVLQKPKGTGNKTKDYERSLENIMKHLENCRKEDEINIMEGLNIAKSKTNLVETVNRIKSKEEDLENLIQTMVSPMKPAFQHLPEKSHHNKKRKEQTAQKIKKTLSQMLEENIKNPIDIPPVSVLQMKEKDYLKNRISDMENLRDRLLSQLVDKKSSTETSHTELRRMYKKFINLQRENKVIEKRIVYLMQQNFEKIDDLKDNLRYLTKQESDIVYTYRDIKSKIPDVEKMQFENSKIISRLQEIPLKVNSSTVKDLHQQLVPLCDKKLSLENDLLRLKRESVELNDRLNHKRRMHTLEKAETETDIKKLQATTRFLTDLKKDLTVRFEETKHRIRENSVAELQEIKHLEANVRDLKSKFKKLAEERKELLKMNEGLKDKIAKKTWEINSKEICQKYDL